MGDCVFRAVLYARTAFDTSINIRRCGFAINYFKDIRWANIFADCCPCTFIVVDLDCEIAFFVLIGFNYHCVDTPSSEEWSVQILFDFV